MHLRRMKTFFKKYYDSVQTEILFYIYIHKSLTDWMDLLEIAKKNFVSVNSRCLNYSGTF